MLTSTLIAPAARLRSCLWSVCGFVILTAAGFYYYHPSERILGQADAASYAFSGIALARGEGFGPQRPILDAMPSEARESTIETRFPLGLRDAAPKLRSRPFYLGWQLGAKNPGSLVPRFPPGYPTILALAYLLAGWKGLLAVNGALTLLSGVLVMYIASKWAGPAAGFLTVALWAVFPLNIWIGNTTLAEPLVAVLGLGAVAAWVRTRESRNFLWPILLGICVGMAPIVKLDAIPWLVLPVVYAWDNRRDGIWRASLPLVATIPCLIGSAADLLGAQSGYLKENLVALFVQPAIWACAAVAVAGLFIAGIVAWQFRVFSKGEPNQSQTKSKRLVRLTAWLKWVAFVILSGVFGYFYFVRPRWAGADQIYWAPMGRVVPSLREITLLRLSWYLPPVALWLAMLSAEAAMLWAREVWMRTFATVGVAILLFVSFDHINFPVEPFAGRRYLPQAVPVLIVALAGANVWFRQHAKLSLFSSAIVGLIVLYASVHGIWVNAKMNSRADAAGLLDKIRVLSETVGPEGIVVLRQSSPLAEVAPLLAFGFQRDVLAIQVRSSRDLGAIEQYLKAQEQAGHTIWLWTSNADDRLGFPAQACGVAVSQEITVPFLHMTTTDKPFTWDIRTWKFSLRKINLTPTVGEAVPINSPRR